MENLKGISLIPDSGDVFSWRNNVDDVFFVKSCYTKSSLVEEEDKWEKEVIKAVRQIWLTKVSSKIKNFVWRFLLNIIPIRYQLARKWMVHNSHEKVCACCFEEDGTVSHLYFDCRVCKKVQENMFVWLDMKEIFF